MVTGEVRLTESLLLCPLGRNSSQRLAMNTQSVDAGKVMVAMVGEDLESDNGEDFVVP